MKVHKNKNTEPVTELIDYQIFCGFGDEKEESTVKEITVDELSQWQVEGKDFQLVDVREPYEYEIANLDGDLIPLDEVTEQVNKISSDKDVVVHCRSGKRSADAIRSLEKLGFKNLYNLKGGILAWAEEKDTEMAKY